MPAIEVQGHRGARGLAPENTLAGFEVALDCGVTSIETDLHLTKDDVAVLSHDPHSGAGAPLIREQTLEILRGCRVSGPLHAATPLADRFGQERGVAPHGIPTLAEFFAFVAAYGSRWGQEAGKTPAAQACAGRLVFDLELKRVPFFPETIGDGFTGTAPGLLEHAVVAAIRQAGVVKRTRVRSFDHRSVRAARQLEPTFGTGLLLGHAAPANLGGLLDGADFYCPDFRFVDAEVVHQVHEAGKRIIPYTVNEASAWQRLLAWGVDGVTTDYPDRLITWMQEHGITLL